METVLILLAVFAVVFFAFGIKTVQQATVIIVERLGKYNGVLTSGINFMVPFFDKPKYIEWKYPSDRIPRQICVIDLRETVYDFPPQDVITKDNVNIKINALIYFQITDPLKVAYELASLQTAIEKLTQTTLRNLIGELELDQTLISRETINAKLRAILDEASNKWGVKVNRVELQDITPPNAPKSCRQKARKKPQSTKPKARNRLKSLPRKVRLRLK